MEPTTINYIYCACGVGIGVIFTSIILTIGFLIDIHKTDKRHEQERKDIKEEYERKLVRQRNIEEHPSRQLRFV